MVKHIIIWKLKSEFTEEEKAACRAEAKRRLESLNGKIEGMIDLRVITTPYPTSNGDMMLDSSFESTEALALPWLESNDALPIATRMETRLPWRPTRGSLTSPSYLVRNRTLGPPLENHPETPPSSRR